MKSITITVDTEGTPTVEAHGFKGQGCEAATKAFEQSLGAVSKRSRKSEYHQTEIVKTTQSLRGAA